MQAPLHARAAAPERCGVPAGLAHAPLAAARPLADGAPGRCCPGAACSGAHGRRGSLHRARASSSGNSEPAPGEMTLDDARRILGLGKEATFEQTVQAKNKLVGKAGSDDLKVAQIETAYDLLLMRSMKARISGELQPARDVRYADVPKYRPVVPREKSWQEKVAERLPGRPQVQSPQRDSATSQGIIFGTLAASALAQDFFLASTPGDDNVPGLQLGLAFGASIYFLRDGKRLSFVRAGALATTGLVLGAIFGSALQGWLRVDIFPLGALHSPAVLVGELAIFGMWMCTYFLA